MSAESKTYTVTLVREGAMCFIPVPFDPLEAFGKVRAPVTVTLDGYSCRSTIAAMGTICVPLRRSHREAAGLQGTETLKVRLALDVAPRIVAPPGDLVDALRRVPGAWQAWAALSYTYQREHAEAIESAKAAETRARRIAAAVEALAAIPPRTSQIRKRTRLGAPHRRCDASVGRRLDAVSLLRSLRSRGLSRPGPHAKLRARRSRSECSVRFRLALELGLRRPRHH
jgi:Bacteriocin-protection, YdeI or OmpD-Associated/Domain of unknown function (DUF1905)